MKTNEDSTRVDDHHSPTDSPTAASNEVARAFREGWATGYQERAEGLEIDWSQEASDRPAAETAALERWLFVEAARVPRPAVNNEAINERYVETRALWSDGISQETWKPE